MAIELNAHADRFRVRHRATTFDSHRLAAATGAEDVSDLWDRLASRLYAIPIGPVRSYDHEALCPGDSARVAAAARAALSRRVDLLGTGTVELGTPIDWHRDFKTQESWPLRFMKDINYTNLGRPSDVKVPWEISRLQWLIPVGQLYLLNRDERCAAAVRTVFEEWIEANPYGYGVNWTCTMEVAMRILSWTWFFHVFAGSASWADETFRRRFLTTLYLHGEFTARYIERSDVNGNHFTADAAGLVFAGLFFGEGETAGQWAEDGWRMLCDELPKQVSADGVDFEGSVAYHRLVLELFFFAARFREACGLPVSDAYRSRVIEMARFANAYSRPQGTTPLVGDADDARAFGFGGQAIGDHRYLAGMVGAHWSVADLVKGFSGDRSDVFWSLGPRAAALIAYRGTGTAVRGVTADVMRNERDHVFVDCGPVGQAGAGDIQRLSGFEAVLDGVHLSALRCLPQYRERRAENRFRSTAYHNTPQVDGEG